MRSGRVRSDNLSCNNLFNPITLLNPLRQITTACFGPGGLTPLDPWRLIQGAFIFAAAFYINFFKPHGDFWRPGGLSSASAPNESGLDDGREGKVGGRPWRA